MLNVPSSKRNSLTEGIFLTLDIGILVVDGNEVVVIVFATNGDVPSRAVFSVTVSSDRSEREMPAPNWMAFVP